MMRRTFVLVAAAILDAGCNGPEPPTAPPVVNPPVVNPPVPRTLTISHVGPKEGWPFYHTEVTGTDLAPGVRLTFGGLEAPVFFRNGILVTSPPWREAGT